jgi:CheY-like chemotaxis protein/MinD-like ATPase involved in chromosome partitioning or flagellar assembly
MPEKILVVDDDVDTLRLVGSMLQRQGYETLSANNGALAISMAKNEKPDLIILDVMMPDMDGYQVTKELRMDPELAETPILMFTAKTQVDDKVAGYDAGVDDYLTKPVHPAELAAHIKSLLARTRAQATAPAPKINGYTIGIVGCKGGLGVSTLALNLAVSFSKINNSDVIAAELRSGQGSWASELGFSDPSGLSDLLKLKPTDITPSVVEKSLISTSFGVRLLLASNLSIGMDYIGLGDRLLAIVNSLSQIAPIVILDIGTSFLPGFDKVCGACKEIVVLTEPQPNIIKRTQFLQEELRSVSAGSGRTIDLVLFNRVRSEVQLTFMQVNELLGGTPVSVMIPPAPELAYQAGLKREPMLKMQPDGLVAQQIGQLTALIQSHRNK